LPDNQAFPLIRWETEPRRDKACLVSTTGRKAKKTREKIFPLAREDLGGVKSIDYQGI